MFWLLTLDEPDRMSHAALPPKKAAPPLFAAICRKICSLRELGLEAVCLARVVGIALAPVLDASWSLSTDL